MAALSATVFNPLSAAGQHHYRSSSRAMERNSRKFSSASPVYDFHTSLPSFCSFHPSTKKLSKRSRSSSWATISGRWVVGVEGRERWRQSVVVFSADNGNQGSEVEKSNEAEMKALEAKVGVGRRARKLLETGSGDGPTPKPPTEKPKEPAKGWESMNVVEKAWSLYIDPEKGLLFWLNKLAYASIFVIIGGWIVFRFIGPALGWYELDQPLLSPERLLDDAP